MKWARASRRRLRRTAALLRAAAGQGDDSWCTEAGGGRARKRMLGLRISKHEMRGGKRAMATWVRSEGEERASRPQKWLCAHTSRPSSRHRGASGATVLAVREARTGRIVLSLAPAGRLGGAVPLVGAVSSLILGASVPRSCRKAVTPHRQHFSV